MFGLSKREKEEREFQQEIAYALDDVMDQFFIQLSVVASNNGIRLTQGGDIYMSKRFLITILAFAFEIGNKIDAEEKTINSALKLYLESYRNCESSGKDMYRKMLSINPDPYASIFNSAKLAITMLSEEKKRNEQFFGAVARSYLFETPQET